MASLSELLLQMTDDSGSQAAVGIGMGTGVGFMQWIMLRQYRQSVQKWWWFSILGFTVAYLIFDWMAAHIDLAIPPEYALPLATALGALLSSFLQSAFLLRSLTPGPYRWMAYSTLGWLAAHLVTSGMFIINFQTSGHLPIALVVVAALCFLTVGGPILGFFTGRFMVPFLNKETEAPAAE